MDAELTWMKLDTRALRSYPILEQQQKYRRLIKFQMDLFEYLRESMNGWITRNLRDMGKFHLDTIDSRMENIITWR